MLAEAGYECDAAETVSCAESFLQARQYDLLITDPRLEDGRGTALIERLRRSTPGLPVIVATTDPSLTFAIKCIELSVACLLVKMTPREEFVDKVRSILADSHSSRVLHRIRNRLQGCADDLSSVKLPERGCEQVRMDSTRWIPISTLQALAGCLEELVALESEAGGTNRITRFCELLQCPVWRVHRNAIHECTVLLHETKRRFKSKELARVREILEGLLKTLR
jgi:DNA-binding response OmpR family regulator